jgi:hypothetical protein
MFLQQGYRVFRTLAISTRLTVPVSRLDDRLNRLQLIGGRDLFITLTKDASAPVLLDSLSRCTSLTPQRVNVLGDLSNCAYLQDALNQLNANGQLTAVHFYVRLFYLLRFNFFKKIFFEIQ